MLVITNAHTRSRKLNHHFLKKLFVGALFLTGQYLTHNIGELYHNSRFRRFTGAFRLGWLP